MIKDITESLGRALLRQGWLFGHKANRIGDPFVWVDGDQTASVRELSDTVAALQYASMFEEVYPTPVSIVSDDMDHMQGQIEQVLREFYAYMVPFLDPNKADFDKYLRGTAAIRAQDYSTIRRWCGDLPKAPVHLDIGPGLGTHATYSLLGFSSNYIGVEASAFSYNAQRKFYRFLTRSQPTYLDPVDCETFGLDEAAIAAELRKDYRIKHVPSWLFPLVDDACVDVVTATWVLNEVSTSGILWLLSNIVRTLRVGGYIYIRDSGVRKPLRHNVDYDALLAEIGCEPVQRLEVRNRIDYYGVPRVYRRTSASAVTFDELVDRVLGKFKITAQMGGYEQNL